MFVVGPQLVQAQVFYFERNLTAGRKSIRAKFDLPIDIRLWSSAFAT